MPKQRSSAPALPDWQPPTGKRADKFKLADIDPGATPWSTGDKERDRAQLEKIAEEIDALQEMLYSDRRFGVLVVLQGMDASGKDGTIRAVFSRTSPLGVHAIGWKAPNEEERAHDFLWRIHQAVPRRGDLVVFNRSHYEDVLVPVVDGSIDKAETERRYRQINDFERMLTEHRTLVLKFMLHISYEEQRKQLQQRVDDPTKRWKFMAGDLDVRKKWRPYQKAYQAFLRATSTAWAPWTIVPADSRSHRNLMVATLVRDALRSLKLRYPPDPPGLAGLKIQ